MDDNVYKNPIRIVIADDHEIVRVGLRRLITTNKSYSLVGEAKNGAEAVELVERNKPDIVLLDILMPVMDGIKATQIIKEKKPEVYVIMLTAFEDLEHLETAIKAGADGYLTKDISTDIFDTAFKNVMEGERVFSQNILNLLNNKFIFFDDGQNSTVFISKREQEILNMVAQGMTSQEIADKLFISVRTVQTHRSNIMTKLGVKNTAELLRYVYRKESLNRENVNIISNN